MCRPEDDLLKGLVGQGTRLRLDAEGVQHVTDARADDPVEFFRFGGHSDLPPRAAVTASPQALACRSEGLRGSCLSEYLLHPENGGAGMALPIQLSRANRRLREPPRFLAMEDHPNWRKRIRCGRAGHPNPAEWLRPSGGEKGKPVPAFR